MSLAGTLAFCFGNMVSARISARKFPVFASTGYGMLYGSTGLAIYALMRGHAFTVEWTPAYLGGLVYLALIASVLAFACYLTLLGRIGADRAAYVTVLGPVVALAVSTVVENFQWTHRGRARPRRGADRQCAGAAAGESIIAAPIPPPARPPTDCRARR